LFLADVGRWPARSEGIRREEVNAEKFYGSAAFYSKRRSIALRPAALHCFSRNGRSRVSEGAAGRFLRLNKLPEGTRHGLRAFCKEVADVSFLF
jgi:hypothetical protein